MVLSGSVQTCEPCIAKLDIRGQLWVGCFAKNHTNQTEFADCLGLFYTTGLVLSSSELFLKLCPVLYSFGCYLVNSL